MTKRKFAQSDAPGELLQSVGHESLNSMSVVGALPSSMEMGPTTTKKQRRSSGKTTSRTFNEKSQKPEELASTEDHQAGFSLAESEFKLNYPLALELKTPGTAPAAAVADQSKEPCASILSMTPILDNSDDSRCDLSASGSLATTHEHNDSECLNSKTTRASGGSTKQANPISNAKKAKRKHPDKEATGQTRSQHTNLKRINQVVRAKVQQINEYIQQNHSSTLTKSPGHDNAVIVSESNLLGALMSMHADFEISGDPRRASLLDIDDVILATFEEHIGHEAVLCHVVNLAKQSTFEEGIKLKIRGHLEKESANLLQIQLEMNTRRLERAAASNLLAVYFAVFDCENEVRESDVIGALVDSVNMTAPRAMANTTTRVDCGSTDGKEPAGAISAKNGVVRSAEDNSNSVVRLIGHEIGRRGVCPAPKA